MASHPLLLPEILAQIFEWLADDRVSLMRACRVNATWFDEATNVLWREASLWAFLDMDPSRSQIYASKVYSLDHSYKSWIPSFDYLTLEILETMTFPQLKNLNLRSYPVEDLDEPGKVVHVDHHFQSTLETLCIGAGKLPDFLLDHTSIKLPRLREFSMNFISKSIDASSFLKFLQNLPSVDTMIFAEGMNRVITDQAFIYFANRQNLERLELNNTFFTRAVIENAITSTSRPFEKLQCLVLRINSGSVPSLVRAISNGPIKDLKLYIMDDEGSILDHISSIRQLQRFKIYYCKDRVISRKEVMSLGELKQLRSLTLHTINSWRILATVKSSELDDECMRQLTTHLEQLQELSCSIECGLTIKCIIAIAKNRPTLKRLKILGGYDFQPLVLTKEVLFPHLKRLRLNDVGVESLQRQLFSAKDVALLLRRHAPNLPLDGLKFINHDVEDDSDFAIDVMKHFSGDVEFDTQQVDLPLS